MTKRESVVIKRGARAAKPERDVLDELGALIGGQLKKGVSKIERLLAEARRRSPKREAKKDDDGGEFLAYLKAFLDDRNVASIAPSSKYVAERVAKAMRIETARVVVEYGPAQGAITRHLLHRMRPDARLVAVEFNGKLYADLVANLKDSRLIPVHGDVHQIDKIMAKLGISSADAVTSGVPFSYFSPRARHELLAKTSNMLRRGGRFAPYQFTTHLIPLLKDYFRTVDTQFEVRNIPPCFVFAATK